ncbi:hypothetical protein FQN57_004841 [Myotisia sp. PD_48]|nr:hypothetical protein FQN57_004841 [Myotisia sp. PD_48]
MFPAQAAAGQSVSKTTSKGKARGLTAGNKIFKSTAESPSKEFIVLPLGFNMQRTGLSRNGDENNLQDLKRLANKISAEFAWAELGWYKIAELGQLHAAQTQGYRWMVASGYDGPQLLDPPLTNFWPKATGFYSPNGFSWGGNMPTVHEETDYSLSFLVHEPRSGEPNGGKVGNHNTNESIPGFPKHYRLAILKPRNDGTMARVATTDPISDQEDVLLSGQQLPRIGKALARAIKTLPPLSQSYLARHIHNPWQFREWYVNGTQHTRLGCTPRTVHKSRLLNRGHSNGYLSFGDLMQLDFSTSSIEHFSIMKKVRGAGCNQKPNCEDIPHQTSAPDFNVFQHMVKRPELVIIMAKHLRIQELLILYSISKPFHYAIRARMTSVVVAQASYRAKDSVQIFPFRCYNRLCIPDPAMRPHPVATKAQIGIPRQVPSLRWLLMVCYREMVCHEIMTIMAEDGCSMPKECELVLKKIWFLMDIPDNIRRIALVQNPDIFTDIDIFFATTIFVKMDMRFTDPITGSGKDGMRRLLLSQPGLTMYWKTLKRTALVAKLDVMKLYLRWRYDPRPNEVGQPLFGIPPNEIGITRFECWGKTGSRVELQRPDELLLKESIRRQLNLQQQYTDMFLWGYVNPRTLDNIPPVPERRPLERLEGMEAILVRPAERRREACIVKPISKQVVPYRIRDS